MTSRGSKATARTSSEARAVARTQTLIKGEHGIGTVRKTTLPGGLRIVTETLPSVPPRPSASGPTSAPATRPRP